MEKWNELCYILSENLPTNTSEQLFELKVVQAFEKLGWSEFNNEIAVRESIQLGASNRISPDLILKSQEKGNLFIVEVKKPSIEVDNSTFKGQLSSYMGIMRVDLGILIGNKIQVFLDGKFFNKNGIVLIDEIEFKRDIEKGLKFVQLFSKENYNKEDIENHAQEKIQQLKEIEDFKKLKTKMLSENYGEKIIEYLKSELQNEFDTKVIDKVFKVLQVKIESKKKIVSLDNYQKPKARKYKTFENINETSGKLPIGKYVRKTFNDLVESNLIDRNEIERLQRGDYSKLTFDIQFPFLAKENSPYYERIRYWKNPYQINGEIYFVCSQWYEVPANNDRPYYEEWLKKMKSK
ncbi:type I restriction enzyme HsdR N-terminal domain-containing protein [Polaribacter sp. KT 15]|uniref:type I restriction enzyme HsdR N-terminal domain-containing protein n=1 Tax=Polaribacter sp. KT 15 TaxID=1896175 RepID=UPI00090BE98E|nr:type I restriction enzyme HsdR N-terminal domain-containing protein [Polaribacter sp. KT 15]SHM82768.1 Type I restriction enzyme R protein N terminus (HSDR_N) [Polaribacter sp. KT 15]SHM83107.1 Type I restriction enzyme R protein N terminus (HSDR_N) [Polaribacter sp. KT 15]